jgi:serine/threonine-protein kinase
LPDRLRWLQPALLAALIVAVAGTAAFITWLFARTPPTGRRPLYLELGPEPAEYFQDGSPRPGVNAAWQRRPKNSAIALSPNGEVLIFAAASGDQPPQLYLRDLGRGTASPIPGTERAAVPLFAPDGRSIAFWSAAASAWMRMPLDGSSQPVQVCQSGPPFGGTWAPDDTLIFANEWGPLWVVPASGGTPKPLTVVPPDSKESHRLPHLLPDGRGVLFTVLDYSPFSVADWNAARVEVVPRAGGKRTRVLDDAADAQYLPTGHLLYARRGGLECVPFDLSRLEVSGGAIGVQPNVMQSVDTASTNSETGAAQVAVSQTGTLAFLTGGIAPLPDFADFVWIDRTGRLEPVPAIPPGPYFGASLSRDGRRLAFRGAGTKPGLWVYDFGRGVPQQVTTAASHRWPLWTPDDRQIVYSTSEKGRWTLALRDLDGGAPPTLLAPGYGPACWSRDGRILVFTTAFNPTQHIVEQSDIWVLRRDGGTITTAPWLQTPADEDHPSLSPDGRWLAYASTEPGPGQTSQVYVRPLSGTGGPWQVSDRGGVAPRWSPDGKELFYLSLDAESFLFSSAVGVGTIPKFGPPRKIVELPRAVATTPLSSYDTVDGQRFIYLHRRILDMPPPLPPRTMHIVLNWFEELKTKGPAGR